MAGNVFIRSGVLVPPSPPDPDPPPPSTSPTGRDPDYLWSAAQQGVWEQMEAQQHWYWLNVKANADKTGTPQERYDDKGEWCTFVYQTTGDTAYATKAKTKLFGLLNLAQSSIGANNCRENFTFYVILVNWLWPSMDSTEKANAITYLERWANYALAIGTGSIYQGGFRLDDTDPLFGYYGGLALLHYFNVPENTNYLNWLNQANAGASTNRVVGDVTLPNNTTIRDAQEGYITSLLPGGVWMESSEYNPGTSLLAMMLHRGAKDIKDPADPYPGLTSYFEDYPYAAWHGWTPDYLSHVQWGDEENPRSFTSRIWSHWRSMAAISGLAGQTNSAAGEFGLAAANEVYARYPSSLNNSNFHSRAWFFYNPYGTEGTLPSGQTSHYASGMGMQFVKDDESLFWAWGPNRTNADHEVKHGACFQLYRDGEWVIRHPIAYDTAQPPVQWSNRGVNGIVLAGLAGHMNTRGVTRQEEGADWWALTYDSSGSYYPPGYYDPPAEFCHQAERRIVYFKENGFDVIVVRDVVDAEDPRTLAKFDRYRTSSPNDQGLINAQEAVKLCVFHFPTQPSIASQVATVTTPGGTTVKCHTLLPASATLAAVDESVLWSGVAGVSAGEKKWQLTVRETTEQQVTVFLHVLIAGNGTQPAISGASSGGVTVGTRAVTFGASSTTVS